MKGWWLLGIAWTATMGACADEPMSCDDSFCSSGVTWAGELESTAELRRVQVSLCVDEECEGGLMEVVDDGSCPSIFEAGSGASSRARLCLEQRGASTRVNVNWNYDHEAMPDPGTRYRVTITDPESGRILLAEDRTAEYARERDPCHRYCWRGEAKP